jgi:hypothetical protein
MLNKQCSLSVIALLTFIFSNTSATDYANYICKQVQHPLIWGPAFLISAYVVGVKVQARNTTPTKELRNWWDYLFYNKNFRLNRAESLWDLGSSSIYITSQERYNRLNDSSPLTAEEEDDLNMDRVELRYDQCLTPFWLQYRKPYIIMCCKDFLLRVNKDNLNKFVNSLDNIITKYEPSNIWERILQRQADIELLRDLKYRRDQMKAFQDIVYTACSVTNKN